MKVSYADKAMANYRWWRKLRGGVWERWAVSVPGENRRLCVWYPVSDDARFRHPYVKPKGVVSVFPPLSVEDWRKKKTD